MQSPYNVQSSVDAAKLIGKIKHFANYNHEIVSALMVKKGYLKVLNWHRVLTHQQLVILKNLKLMACSVLRVFKATFKEKKIETRILILSSHLDCFEHGTCMHRRPCTNQSVPRTLMFLIYCCRLILIKHSQHFIIIHYLQSIPCFDCIYCFPLWDGAIN